MGYRIRLRRVVLGMSQQQLGEAVGASSQKIDKYEQGANRVDACCLWDISRVLDVPLSFFYIEDAPRKISAEAGRKPDSRFGWQTTQPDSSLRDISGRREALDLLEAFNHIADPAMRRNVLNLVQSMCTARPAG